MNTLMRTIENVDRDLDHLRNVAADSLRGGDRWNITWERINELLEERRKITEVTL